MPLFSCRKELHAISFYVHYDVNVSSYGFSSFFESNVQTGSAAEWAWLIGACIVHNNFIVYMRFFGMAESCVPLPVGGYETEFTDSIPDSLSCPVCLLPFRDPHLVSCCGARFCEPCIGRVKDASQPCPLCKQEFVSLLDRGFQRKVLELNVRCSRKKDGCQWVGELRRVDLHERKGCWWAVVECSYQCGVHLPRRLMAEHEHDICPQRPTNVIVESFTKKMEERLEKELEKMDTRLKTIETDLATESERQFQH